MEVLSYIAENREITQHTLKLGYNEHEYNEFMAIARK
jgi:hypothetical protein